MGFNTPHALGRVEKVGVEIEATAGTHEQITTADMIKVLKAELSVDIERKNREDKRQTRSLVERITGKGVAAWALDTYLLPSGTAGTPPDVTDLLQAVFGTYTNTPATSDVYTLAAAQAMSTLTILRHVSDVVAEQLFGAWVNQLTLTISGGDDPKLRFEGNAMGHIHTGYGTVLTAVGPVVTVQSGEGIFFDVNSLIQVGSDDNSGAGWNVDSKSGDILTLDGSPTAVPTDAVAPFAPADTGTVGSPTPGITGSLVIDSQTLVITGFDQVLNNNMKPLDDHAFEQFPQDAIPGFRDVTGTISVRARRDFITFLAERKQFSAQDIQVISGTGAGKILTVDMNQAEFNFAPLDVPEADEAVIALPYTALATSTGEDETTWSFT